MKLAKFNAITNCLQLPDANIPMMDWLEIIALPPPEQEEEIQLDDYLNRLIYEYGCFDIIDQTLSLVEVENTPQNLIERYLRATFEFEHRLSAWNSLLKRYVKYCDDNKILYSDSVRILRNIYVGDLYE